MDLDRLFDLYERHQSHMDVRDTRVSIPFHSIIYQQYEEKKIHFNSELFLEEVRDWLI